MTSSQLQSFNFQSEAVRVINRNGDPWFVAKDIGDILGYKDPTNAVKLHCKGVAKHHLPTSSGIQEFNIIPERDVYRLIMRSKLPAAERFEEWVVGEVLPCIRQTGAYMTPEQIEKVLCSPDSIINLANQIKSLQAQVQVKDNVIEDQKSTISHLLPEAQYAERIMDSSRLFPTTLIAKHLEVSAVALNRFLKEKGVQYRVGGAWVLKERYQSNGYAKIVTHTIERSSGPDTVKQMKWTEKGQRFVIDMWDNENS